MLFDKIKNLLEESKSVKIFLILHYSDACGALHFVIRDVIKQMLKVLSLNKQIKHIYLQLKG